MYESSCTLCDPEQDSKTKKNRKLNDVNWIYVKKVPKAFMNGPRNIGLTG